MKYFVNTSGSLIFLADIRKAIEIDDTGRKVIALEDSLCEKSSELKNHLRLHNLCDVTKEYLEQVEQASQPQQTIAVDQQQAIAEKYVRQPSEARLEPKILPRTESIMVDENQSSRVLNASDGHLHAAHLNKGTRANADTNLIADNYDNPNSRKAEQDSRTSYLVEDESRAQHFSDPRLQKRAQVQVPVTPPTPQFLNSLPPMQPQVAQKFIQRQESRTITNYNTEHAHDKYDPNWGTNSKILEQRRAMNPISGTPHDHTYNVTGTEPLDPRVQANLQFVKDPGLHPLVSMGQQGINAPMIQQDPNINPLISTIFQTAEKAPEPSSESSEEVDIPVILAQSEKPKRGRKSSKTSATKAPKASKKK